MVYTKNLVAVCAGRDAVRAAAQGMQVLHLCLGLSENGALERRQLPAMQRGCFLGLCDPPRGLRLCSPERLALDLAFEAKRVNAPGVFADFERETAQTLALLRAFDEALAEDGIPLYVPVNIGRDLEHAVLTVSTALSGGSLTAYFSSLQGIYGAHRVAAFLQPVSQDFTLPSASPDGKPLSACLPRPAHRYFSRTSCVRGTLPTQTARARRTSCCSTTRIRSRRSSRSSPAAVCRPCSRCIRTRPGLFRRDGCGLGADKADEVGRGALDLIADLSGGDHDGRNV